MIEPTSVASQAGTRNTASMTSRETTGISATRQVSVRLSSGSISCVNMIAPSMRRGVWRVMCRRRRGLILILATAPVGTTAAPAAPVAFHNLARAASGLKFADCAGGGSAGFFHLGCDLLALFHEAPVRRTLLHAVGVLLKSRARLESLHHHPEADLRADVDIGGTELRTEDIGPGCQRFFQRCHGGFVAAVAQRAGQGGCRTRQHTIDHRRLDAAAAEEHPAVIGAARRAVDRWRETCGGKGVREVSANGPAFGHHGAAVHDRRNLAHGIHRQVARLLLIAALQVHDLEPVRRSHFLQHPVHHAPAGHGTAVEHDFVAHCAPAFSSLQCERRMLPECTSKARHRRSARRCRAPAASAVRASWRASRGGWPAGAAATTARSWVIPYGGYGNIAPHRGAELPGAKVTWLRRIVAQSGKPQAL